MNDFNHNPPAWQSVNIHQAPSQGDVLSHGPIPPKPIAILYFNAGHNKSKIKLNAEMLMIEKMLINKLSNDYHVIVFAVQDQETKLEILSPTPSTEFKGVQSDPEELEEKLREICNPSGAYQNEYHDGLKDLWKN